MGRRLRRAAREPRRAGRQRPGAHRSRVLGTQHERALRARRALGHAAAGERRPDRVQRRAAARQRQRRLLRTAARPERDRRAGAAPRPRAHGRRHGARDAADVGRPGAQAEPRATTTSAPADGRRALDGRGQPHPELDAGHHHAAAGAGWRIVGSRQTLTGQMLDALHPGIASFALDLTAVPQDRLVLLVAVLRAGADDVALAPAPLRDLVLANANLAVRSLRITGTSVNAPAIRNPFPTVHYALAAAARRHAQRAARHRAGNRARSAGRCRQDPARQGGADRRAAHARRHDGVRRRARTGCTSPPACSKVAMLYASFELEAQVNQLATDLPAPTAAKFLERVRLEFGKTIERSVAHQQAGRVAHDQVQGSAARAARQAEPLPRRAASDACGRPREDLHRAGTRTSRRATPCTASATPTSTVRSKRAASSTRPAPTASGPPPTTATGPTSTCRWPRGGRPERNGSSSAAMTALAMATCSRTCSAARW